MLTQYGEKTNSIPLYPHSTNLVSKKKNLQNVIVWADSILCEYKLYKVSPKLQIINKIAKSSKIYYIKLQICIHIHMRTVFIDGASIFSFFMRVETALLTVSNYGYTTGIRQMKDTMRTATNTSIVNLLSMSYSIRGQVK